MSGSWWLLQINLLIVILKRLFQWQTRIKIFPKGGKMGEIKQMNQNEQPIEKQAQYIVVDSIEMQLLDGYTRTFRKGLLKSENLEISQIIIKESGEAEDYGISSMDKMQYILNGEATLRQGGTETGLSQGDLIIIPPDTPWGPGLFVASDQLTLLDIAPRVESQSAAPSAESDYSNAVRIVKPEDVPTYPPAGHLKTMNRCLFADEHVEIIEGLIDGGGGAERHLHREHEQMLYVLEGSDTPLLIYYPKGTPHGTAGGISTRLKLLVIYSPPLGESRNALG
jgi:quercetin dioxygenase-like cupin family protein